MVCSCWACLGQTTQNGASSARPESSTVSWSAHAHEKMQLARRVHFLSSCKPAGFLVLTLILPQRLHSTHGNEHGEALNLYWEVLFPPGPISAISNKVQETHCSMVHYSYWSSCGRPPPAPATACSSPLKLHNAGTPSRTHVKVARASGQFRPVLHKTARRTTRCGSCANQCQC